MAERPRRVRRDLEVARGDAADPLLEGRGGFRQLFGSQLGHHRLLRPLEERVGDADPLGSEAARRRQRVELPLRLVLLRRLRRAALVEPVGLVVDHQRRLARARHQQVDRSSHRRAGQLDQERVLGLQRRRAGADLAGQVRADPGRDQLPRATGVGHAGRGPAAPALRRRPPRPARPSGAPRSSAAARGPCCRSAGRGRGPASRRPRRRSGRCRRARPPARRRSGSRSGRARGASSRRARAPAPAVRSTARSAACPRSPAAAPRRRAAVRAARTPPAMRR